MAKKSTSASNSRGLLLDTHILLWLSRGDSRLTSDAIATIERASMRGEIYLSAITLWEIGYLVRKGRLHLANGLSAFWSEALKRLAAAELPIKGNDVLAYHELPDGFHGNPGDRFLVAQAVSNKLALLTADSKILAIASKLQSTDIISP